MNLHSQPPVEVDEIINNIYNQNFKDVPFKIEILKKTSPQMAQYIKTDYLWWRMISSYSKSAESDFLTSLNSLNDKNYGSKDEDYNKLIYFIYQIRYENLKNKSFSKYLTILKFHFFMENINSEEIRKSDSFVKSMFQLMTEFEVFMKYKFLNDHGFQTQKNKDKCRSSIDKIESIQNADYKSFDIFKTYLLGKIYLEIENNYQQAFIKFKKLSIMFPENKIFQKTIADFKKQLILVPIQ